MTTPLRPLDIKLAGVQLIEASAGTGKTFTITTLFLRLLLERDLTVDQLLVVTFTKMATAELRERVRGRLREALKGVDALRNGRKPGGEEGLDADLTDLLRRRQAAGELDRDRVRLATAIRSLDEAAVFTIHGFCQRVLKEHAFESGARFDLELVGELEPLLLEVVQDFWVQETIDAPEATVRALRQCGVTVTTLLKLARQAVAWPAMPVVPERRDPPAPDSGPLAQALLPVADVLARERDAVEAYLIEDRGLSHRSYKRNTVPGWLDRLGDVAAGRLEPTSAKGRKALMALGRSAVEAHLKEGQQLPGHRLFDVVEAVVQALEAHEAAVADAAMAFELKLVERVRTEVKRRKLAQAVQGFDDLLLDLDRALLGPSGGDLATSLARRYPVALIDEFQDTDPVQYRIFQRVYGPGGAGLNTALFLIGDPKQAIYAFRGADVFAYLGAADDVPDARKYTLETNYRSDPRVVEAVNALFQRAPRPFQLEAIDFEPVRPREGARDALVRARGEAASRLEFAFLPRPRGKKSLAADDDRVAALVAEDVVQFLASDHRLIDKQGKPRSLRPRQIAVLTRTNKQAMRVQEALRRRGVKGVLKGDANVLDSTEARELSLVLAALADPTNATAIRSALSTALFSVDGGALHALRTAEDGQAWDGWVRRFSDHGQLWRRSGVVRAFRSLYQHLDIPGSVLRRAGGERKLTNLLHLVELLHRAEIEGHLGVVGLLRWFEELRLDAASRHELGAEATQIRLESDEDAVTLTTMHKSKGLQYDIVYCPFCFQAAELFPDEKRYTRHHSPATQHLTLDIRRDKADDDPVLELARSEALGEALRLTYVALTRAKHRCVVIWGGFSGAHKSALGYLLAGGEVAGSLPGDDTLIAQLSALIAAAPDQAISLQTIGPVTDRRHSATERPPTLTRPHPKRRLTDAVLRLSSFTALTRSAQRASHGAAEAVRDVDAEAVEVTVSPAAAEVPLAAFPRGARAGVALHDVLENVDFDADGPTLEGAVATALRYGGLEADVPETTAALQDALRAPLGPLAEGLRLADIPRTRRLSELEFNLPVADGPDAEDLLAANLQRVLRSEPDAPWGDGYAARVGGLAFEPLRGFLRGFIDLVFEHEGRFFVVDYKSNHLGGRFDDYGPLELRDAMDDHHYHLQYLLYSVALRRYLRGRGLAADAFGGVLYLFLRGMSPSRPGAGVFAARPSDQLLDRLDDALRMPTRRGRAIK